MKKMKKKTKDLMEDLNKSITEQIVDAADKVSVDFKEVKNEEVSPTSNNVELGADMIKSLKELTANLHKQAVERGLRNLEEKRVIRDMWGKKYILGKWYNKWYYRLKFKRSVTEYLLCAGEQYYIENELANVYKPLENMEEIISKKEQ